MKYKFKPGHVVPAYLFVVAVLYGGSKPPCPTNTPPDDVSSPTNSVGESKSRVEVEQWNLSTCSAGQPERESNILCSTSTSCFDYSSPSPSTFTSITNWTARGAYCDWQPITFSDGFQFPVGTNLIDGVTLFAWGEVRVKSTSTSRFDYSLPTRVSLEPNVSSVTHGLTPSNSYLFAWHNACVERCATNRVDASIELFRSGMVAVTLQPTNELPTTIYQLCRKAMSASDKTKTGSVRLSPPRRTRSLRKVTTTGS